MLNFVWESLLTWIQGAMISALDLLDQSMLFAFSPQLITMDHYFPGLNDMWDLIVVVSFGMTLALCIFKIFQNSFLTLSKSYESPVMTILRTIFAFVVITILPLFVKNIFEFADTIYWAILKESGIVSSTENIIEVNVGVATDVLKRVGQEITNIDLSDLTVGNVISGFVEFINPVDDLAQFIVSLVLTVAIVWNYFKLMLEIAERYVVLGIMYYTMPLAAVPLVSRDTSPITKSWLRMLISELMILGLNVWFIIIFRGAILGNAMIEGGLEIHGKTVSSGMLWCFIAVAFLKTAQKIDSHIATLGLTTAQLSSGIGATLIATGMGMGHMAHGVKNAVKGVQGVMSGKKLAQVKADTEKLDNGGIITDKNSIERMPKDILSQEVNRHGGQIKDEAAIASLQKLAPDMVKGKNLTSVDFKDGNFTAHYKDANGKDAVLSFSQKQPSGISKATTFNGKQGFLKDTGTPYNYDDINSGKTSFNEFAEKYLDGRNNVLSTSGKFSEQDLNGATVSADPSGDGVIVKDKDGFEMAKISQFDDEHADGITDNTLIGESDNGLYRADINSDERYPLPDGYSYAGEVLVDNDGNAISEINSTGFVSTGENGYENLSGEFINSNGDVVSDAHYQDSYRTADGSYISADEMRNIMSEKTVSPSDYADNLQYSQDTGFTDAYGNSVNMAKAGWVESESDPGVYSNKFTGGSATGEQIAEHYSNPEYASQSYGGFSNDGKEMYFDNYSKESMDKGDMNNERKYGETPDYSNFTSDKTCSGPSNFSESVETLMDKEYSFAGDMGAKVAQAYMPELKNSNIEKAYITKDSIKVDKNNGDGMIQRESYASEIGSYATSGSFSRVESAGGQKTWLKSTKGNTGREDNSARNNPLSGNNTNPKDNRGARGGKRRRNG